MKLLKFSIVAASITAASVSLADCPATGPLALSGTCTEGGEAGVVGVANGVAAIAIGAQCNYYSAYQTMQAMPAECIGSMTKVCAASISSAEVRAILSGTVSETSQIFSTDNADSLNTIIQNAGGTFGNCSTTPLNLANDDIQLRVSFGADDATRKFNQGVGGPDASSSWNQREHDTVIANLVGNSRHRTAFMIASAGNSNDVGFFKLDGAYPDLVNLVSSNYNLVTNLYDADNIDTTTTTVNGATFGSYEGIGGDMAGDGVGYHHNSDFALDTAPLSTSGPSLPDNDRSR